MKLSKTALTFVLMLLSAPNLRAQNAVIHWQKVAQVIDGFGASDAFESTPFNQCPSRSFLFSDRRRWVIALEDECSRGRELRNGQ